MPAARGLVSGPLNCQTPHAFPPPPCLHPIGARPRPRAKKGRLPKSSQCAKQARKMKANAWRCSGCFALQRARHLLPSRQRWSRRAKPAFFRPRRKRQNNGERGPTPTPLVMTFTHTHVTVPEPATPLPNPSRRSTQPSPLASPSVPQPAPGQACKGSGVPSAARSEPPAPARSWACSSWAWPPPWEPWCRRRFGWPRATRWASAPSPCRSPGAPFCRAPTACTAPHC